MKEDAMDWPEVNCLVEALGALILQYQSKLGNSSLDDDERSDLSNDLAYAQILCGKYERLRDELSSG